MTDIRGAAVLPALAAGRNGRSPQPQSPDSGPTVHVPDDAAGDGRTGDGSMPIEQADLIDLRRKLATLPTIEQAKGMLMGQLGCDADTAYAVLRRWSQHRNVKLRVLCSNLVAAAAQPHPEPAGSLRAFLRSRRLG